MIRGYNYIGLKPFDDVSLYTTAQLLFLPFQSSRYLPVERMDYLTALRVNSAYDLVRRYSLYFANNNEYDILPYDVEMFLASFVSNFLNTFGPITVSNKFKIITLSDIDATINSYLLRDTTIALGLDKPSFAELATSKVFSDLLLLQYRFPVIREQLVIFPFPQLIYQELLNASPINAFTSTIAQIIEDFIVMAILLSMFTLGHPLVIFPIIFGVHYMTTGLNILFPFILKVIKFIVELVMAIIQGEVLSFILKYLLYILELVLKMVLFILLTIMSFLFYVPLIGAPIRNFYNVLKNELFPVYAGFSINDGFKYMIHGLIIVVGSLLLSTVVDDSGLGIGVALLVLLGVYVLEKFLLN